MHKPRKIKQVASRVSKKKQLVNEIKVVDKRKVNSKKELSSITGKAEKDFLLEAEAARMAHRYGGDFKVIDPYEVTTEEDPEEAVIKTADRREEDITLTDHDHVIEKLRKNIRSDEEKDGWEAFYN